MKPNGIIGICIAIVAIVLFPNPVCAQSDSATTFAGTQYYHYIDGPDRGRNTGSVIAGALIDGKGSSVRWYLGAEMADQQQPTGKGGIGPSLFMVADVAWFHHRGKPTVSIIGSLSWLNAAKYDSENQTFKWGPWTGLGVLFHVSDDAKITVGLTGTPASSGFIENIGIGPGLFVTEPEKHAARFVEGAWNKAKDIIDAIL